MVSISQSTAKYVLISPVRDEAEHLQKTIDSVVAQTVRPARWVIVNDGSRDATGEIAEKAAAKHHWIDVVHRIDRGTRSVGPGVVDAFYVGYEWLKGEDYQYLCKMDGDLSFGPFYFEHLLGIFDLNRRLGAASGKCFHPVGNKLIEERIDDESVLGAMKFYRRECFGEIGGFVREVMWDGIDWHRARMLGWQTKSLHDPELQIIHHRQMGSSHRTLVNGRMRWGRGQYFLGTHPLYILASGVNRMRERPFVVGGACIVAGYVSAWMKGAPRYEDPAFRKELHQWQLKRLHLR